MKTKKEKLNEYYTMKLFKIVNSKFDNYYIQLIIDKYLSKYLFYLSNNDYDFNKTNLTIRINKDIQDIQEGKKIILELQELTTLELLELLKDLKIRINKLNISYKYLNIEVSKAVLKEILKVLNI